MKYLLKKMYIPTAWVFSNKQGASYDWASEWRGNTLEWVSSLTYWS